MIDVVGLNCGYLWWLCSFPSWKRFVGDRSFTLQIVVLTHSQMLFWRLRRAPVRGVG